MRSSQRATLMSCMKEPRWRRSRNLRVQGSRFNVQCWKADMASIQRFEDIESWKAGREAVRTVYAVTSEAPFSRDFALCNQVRRASVSIISNIAEGFERGGNKEFLNFLAISKGSCGEVRCQLYVALDCSYISEDQFRVISEKLTETSRLISGLMKYLQQSEFRGSKFRSADAKP